MAFIDLTAPARPITFLLEKLGLRMRETPEAGRINRPGALPTLPDHIARDIGLTGSETDLLRHQWPSTAGPRHPML